MHGILLLLDSEGSENSGHQISNLLLTIRMGIETLTFFLLQLSDQTQLRKTVQILGAREHKHVFTAIADTLSFWKYYYSYIFASGET